MNISTNNTVATPQLRKAVLKTRLMDGFKSMDLSEEDDPGGSIRSEMFIHNGHNYYEEYLNGENNSYLDAYVEAIVSEKINTHENNGDDPAIKQIEIDLFRIEKTLNLADILSTKLIIQKTNLENISNCLIGVSTEISLFTEKINSLNSSLPDSISKTGTATDLGISANLNFESIFDFLNNLRAALSNFCNNSTEVFENIKFSEEEEKVINTLTDITEDYSKIIEYLLTNSEEDLINLGININDNSTINSKFNVIKDRLNTIILK